MPAAPASDPTPPLPSFVLIHIGPDGDVAAIDRRLQHLVTGGSGSVLFALDDGWYAISRAPGKELRVANGGDNDGLATFLGGLDGVDGVALVPADELVRRYEARGPIPSVEGSQPTPDQQWNLDAVRARQGWQLMGGIDNIDWGSIRVGHLDTGYTEHPVFGPWHNGMSPSLRPQEGTNTFDGSPGPRDLLAPKGTPGHGTRSSSVLTGRVDNVFLGVAPRVPVVPYRVTDFVVIDTLFWQNRMGAAITHAVFNSGCPILSISLGDPCYAPGEMGRAVDQAYERGVIIVAAAGNYTSEVTYPGRYSRTIAAGGITRNDEPWNGGSRGISVDVCAPAADIWRAEAALRPDGTVHYGYGPTGDGTTYATVHVSGAAALWMAHHGRKLDMYASHPWQYVEAFRTLIRSTARVPARWDDRLFGAGILDIAKLLSADLPAPNTLVKQDRLAELEHF